jgi:hypothetical protein
VPFASQFASLCTCKAMRFVHAHLYCAFSGLGDSTSVMFCGSFHARAMYLNKHRSATQYACSIHFCLGSVEKLWNIWYYSLRMAAPRHKLFLLVCEADRSVRERLADYYPISISINPRPHRRNRRCKRTFITRHLRANDIADLAAGGKIRDYA